jgi:hypothetical protein
MRSCFGVRRCGVRHARCMAHAVIRMVHMRRVETYGIGLRSIGHGTTCLMMLCIRAGQKGRSDDLSAESEQGKQHKKW